MSEESNQNTHSHWQVSDAGLAEMRRRSAELDSGQVKAIPWEQVWQEVRDQLANFEKLPKSMSDLDDAFQASKSLDPDDRMRLIARLWESLPEEYWAAPSVQDRAGIRAMLAKDDTEELANLPRKIARQLAGIPPAPVPAKVYSAPRRFDLATIFVVTSAYSLLFAIMSGLNFPPGLSLVAGGFITLVGTAQALLFGGNRPRTASVLTGAGLGILGSIAFWMFMPPGIMRREHLVIMTIGYVLQGAILGYVAGAMVGSVFLLADVIRRYLDRRAQASTDDTALTLIDAD